MFFTADCALKLDSIPRQRLFSKIAYNLFLYRCQDLVYQPKSEATFIMVSIRSKLVKEAFLPNSDEFPQNHLCSKLVNLVIVRSARLVCGAKVLSSLHIFYFFIQPSRVLGLLKPSKG
jgi:hypothetical protein